MEIEQNSKDSELVIGLVSPVGVNLQDVLNRLTSLFSQFRYEINVIHLSAIAKKYLGEETEPKDELERLDQGMNNGRALRTQFQRGDFYALLAIETIFKARSFVNDAPAPSKRKVHVVRSLKHTDEVETLRQVYGDGFFLLGISSAVTTRKRYLENVLGLPKVEIGRLIDRDDKEDDPYGQRTRDVFQMADAFVTTDDIDRLSDQLSRILDLLFSKPIVSPTADEYAMFMAYAASLRSADLSRQVGAVLANEHQDIIATGANDVPKSGGGLYWPGPGDRRDYIEKVDFNEKEKNEILLKVMKKVYSNSTENDGELIAKGKSLFKDTGLLGITEYGRAVHAEMEALLSAARNGVSVRGTTLYTTTYPCHNCAKHIVAAGVRKVKYIEPYPKSYAMKLHSDSIDSNGPAESAASIRKSKKVVFEPFVGIGPRRFVDLFSMSLSSGRPLVRKIEGKAVDWNRNTAELRVPMKPLSYLDAEILLVGDLKKLASEKLGVAKTKASSSKREKSKRRRTIGRAK